MEETSPDQFSSLRPKGSSGSWKVRSMALRKTEERLKTRVMYSLLFSVHSGAWEERTVKHLPLAASCMQGKSTWNSHNTYVADLESVQQTASIFFIELPASLS